MSDKKLFKTKFDDHKRVYAVPGDTEIPVRKARNVNGQIIIDETKEMFPLQKYINSFKDSCDIETLLKRFQAGDLSVMDRFSERTAADYVDLTNIPDNFNDMMNMVHDARAKFNELPAEIKEKFDNNMEIFAASAGSDEWMEKMGYVPKDIVKASSAAEADKGEASTEG